MAIAWDGTAPLPRKTVLEGKSLSSESTIAVREAVRGRRARHRAAGSGSCLRD